MDKVFLPRALASIAVAMVIVASLAGCVDAPQAPSLVSSGGSASPTSTASAAMSSTPSTNPNSSQGPTPDPATAIPKPANLTVEILNTSFDASTSTVSVAGVVTNLVSATGTCSVQVSQGSESYTGEAAGVADAAVTYCSGFTVALPEGSTGDWTVTLTFTDGDSAGSATADVQLG